MPTKSIVAPKKHMTQKAIPRPVPKSRGPTQKSKPVPRGKLVPKPEPKSEPKVEPRKQRLTRVPMPPQRIHRTHRSPSRTVFATILSQLSQLGYRPPPNGLPFRPRSPNGLPNPLQTHSSGRPSPGRNPLHVPPLHVPHSPNDPGYVEQKKKNLARRKSQAANKTTIGSQF